MPPPLAGGEGAQKPLADPQAGISGAPAAPVIGGRLLHSEQRVEYRDQDGNILNEEQVKALEGKVEFQTRYETRTRVLDPNGVEIPPPPGGWAPEAIAPPHPDVQGVDQSTKNQERGPVAEEEVPEAKESIEGQKESEGKLAKPASESNDATAKQVS